MPLAALRSILDSRRLVTPAKQAPLVLTERSATNRCPPVHIHADREYWAVRLEHDDYLPLLAELPKIESIRRLPDYLLFSAPAVPPERTNDVAVRTVVCELKSSATGTDSALPQIQLGKLLADYLLQIAAHRLGRADPLVSWSCGLIISPAISTSLLAKGKTRPGKVEPPNFHDKRSGMRIFTCPADPERVDIWLDSLY